MVGIPQTGQSRREALPTASGWLVVVVVAATTAAGWVVVVAAWNTIAVRCPTELIACLNVCQTIPYPCPPVSTARLGRCIGRNNWVPLKIEFRYTLTWLWCCCWVLLPASAEPERVVQSSTSRFQWWRALLFCPDPAWLMQIVALAIPNLPNLPGDDLPTLPAPHCPTRSGSHLAVPDNPINTPVPDLQSFCFRTVIEIKFIKYILLFFARIYRLKRLSQHQMDQEYLCLYF